MAEFQSKFTGQEVDNAIDKLRTWIVVDGTYPTVTISGVTYAVIWKSIPVSGTPCYGIGLHPTTGRIYEIYYNGSSYTATALDTDTKNTAGATNSTSKLFLVGAGSQAANPQTFSNGQVYMTDGTLYLTKATDLSGTANNHPALIVGGTDTAAHLELDANEVHAKASGTTVAPLYLNHDGGNTYLSGENTYSDGTYLYSNSTKVSVEGHTHDNRYYTETEIDTKLSEYLKTHQSIKNLNTNNNSALTVNSSEAIAGSGTISLNGISKTAQEEYLQWGGPSKSGAVSPIGMTLSNEHSANRMAFINGDLITAEYSSDGGTTWTTYSADATAKSKFFTQSQTFAVGRPDESTEVTADKSKTRFTITAQDGNNPSGRVYTDPRKMLVLISSATGLELLVEYRSGTNYKNNGAWTTFGTYSLSGWSGWNDIPLVLNTLGGGANQLGNNWQLRLTFTVKTKNTSYPKTASVLAARIYGQNTWTTPSTLAETGHMYTFDMSKNVTFPAGVSAANFTEGGKSLSTKYQAKGDCLPLSGGNVTGDLALYAASGDSPRLTFQRGKLDDALNDWSLYDGSGYLYIQQRGSENTSWETRATFSQSGVNFAGTISEGGTSLAAKYIAKSLTSAKGDMIYASDANTPARLSIGSNGQFLSIDNGIPKWVNNPNTDTHYTNYLQIKGNGTEAVKYTQDSDKTLNLKPGNNVSISAASGEITISATDTNTWRGIQNNLTSDSTTDSLSAAQGKALKGLIDGKQAAGNYVTTDTVQSITAAKTFSTINSISDTDARSISTGTNTNSYFQSRKFRGEGAANTYYHAIDFGYSGHNQVDFYEYGGVWNFWKNTTEAATTADDNLCLQIGQTYLKNKSYQYDWPTASGTLALKSDIPTIPTVNNATLTIQKNGTNVATFTANSSTDTTANITVPTKVSELTNDSGFVTSSGVTSVATSGTGLSGGTITSTGTINLDSSSAGNAAADKVILRNAAGSIQTEKLAVSSGTTTKATMQYNSTEDCIEFIFA